MVSARCFPRMKSNVMISSFACREHGILREIDEHTLNFVSTNRLGKSYADEEAAIEVNGTASKKPLSKKDSPFLLYFVEMATGTTSTWFYSLKTL